MEQEKQQQLDPRELDIRIRSIVEQRNNALDTISVLNGQLFMAQEEIKRLQKALAEREPNEKKAKKVADLAATH